MVQKNFSFRLIDIRVKKHSQISWRSLPANEIESIMRKEGLIGKDHIYASRDETYGCLSFVIKGNLAGSVRPETIMDEPTPEEIKEHVEEVSKALDEIVPQASEDKKDN